MDARPTSSSPWPSGTIERMMRHDDLDTGRLHPSSRSAAAITCVMFSRPRRGRQAARAVEPDNRHFTVDVGGLEVGADVAPIAAEGVEQARGKIEQRHVMIAWHHQAWVRNADQEGAGVLELRPPRALRQVARDRHEIRRESMRSARVEG